MDAVPKALEDIDWTTDVPANVPRFWPACRFGWHPDTFGVAKGRVGASVGGWDLTGWVTKLRRRSRAGPCGHILAGGGVWMTEKTSVAINVVSCACWEQGVDSAAWGDWGRGC